MWLNADYGFSDLECTLLCVPIRVIKNLLMQATEKIRQQAGPNQRTPIVAVTANAMKGDRDKVLFDYPAKFFYKNLLFCNGRGTMFDRA